MAQPCSTSSRIKDVYVHVGLHRTGGESLRQYLRDLSRDLEECGVLYLHPDELPFIADAVLSQGQDKLRRGFLELRNALSEEATFNRYLISHSDLAGGMPGRLPVLNQTYPDLLANLKAIDEGLHPHRVKFLLFVREPSSWAHSVYARHLRYKGFSSFGAFSSEVSLPAKWESVIGPTHDHFGSRLTIAQYEVNARAGITTLLNWLEVPILPPATLYAANTSPPSAIIAEFERINRLADSYALRGIYKQRAKDDELPRSPAYSSGRPAPWPPDTDALPAKGLEALSRRAAKRVRPQPDCENLLPPADVDLNAAAASILPKVAKAPSATRSRMPDQLERLRFELQGRSDLSLIHALAISYLRRDTPHTPIARYLFQRLWTEQGNRLAYELNARWLISALQTFADHGTNSVQREIGCAGYFYANMMKIYEGERAIEQRDPDELYEHTKPTWSGGFVGLGRFEVGGTDLMVNVNAFALQLATRDYIAGMPLIEFLLRAKAAPTVFRRLDRTRKFHNVSIAGFTNSWTFFEAPQ